MESGALIEGDTDTEPVGELPECAALTWQPTRPLSPMHRTPRGGKEEDYGSKKEGWDETTDRVV